MDENLLEMFAVFLSSRPSLRSNIVLSKVISSFCCVYHSLVAKGFLFPARRRARNTKRRRKKQTQKTVFLFLFFEFLARILAGKTTLGTQGMSTTTGVCIYQSLSLSIGNSSVHYFYESFGKRVTKASEEG